MSRGATEDLVDQIRYYELSNLPERTKAALRLADLISQGERPEMDPEFHAALKEHFDDDQLLDLGMCIAFVTGWQRFIETFGIVPDRWVDGNRLPWLNDGEGDGGGH